MCVCQRLNCFFPLVSLFAVYATVARRFKRRRFNLKQRRFRKTRRISRRRRRYSRYNLRSSRRFRRNRRSFGGGRLRRVTLATTAQHANDWAGINPWYEQNAGSIATYFADRAIKRNQQRLALQPSEYAATLRRKRAANWRHTKFFRAASKSFNRYYKGRWWLPAFNYVRRKLRF